LHVGHFYLPINCSLEVLPLKVALFATLRLEGFCCIHILNVCRRQDNPVTIRVLDAKLASSFCDGNAKAK